MGRYEAVKLEVRLSLCYSPSFITAHADWFAFTANPSRPASVKNCLMTWKQTRRRWTAVYRMLAMERNSSPASFFKTKDIISDVNWSVRVYDVKKVALLLWSLRSPRTTTIYLSLHTYMCQGHLSLYYRSTTSRLRLHTLTMSKVFVGFVSNPMASLHMLILQ